jgi:hypothetical protein
MIRVLFFCFPVFFTTMFAQGWQPLGSRSMALGNASVAINDVWAYHNNPAALIGIKKLAFGVSYENRFLLRELQSQGFVLAYPLKRSVFSIGGQTFGYTNFRTYRSGLGYALALTDFLSIGVQINYHLVRLPQDYGRHQTVTAEVGAMAKISDNWHIGFSLMNLTRNKLSSFQEDRYTTALRLGTRYHVSKKVLLLGEIEKNVDYPIRFKTGIEYEPAENLYFRGGFGTAPIEFSFGFGYHWKGIYKLDLGSAYQQIIGWSPNLSFTVQLK